MVMKEYMARGKDGYDMLDQCEEIVSAAFSGALYFFGVCIYGKMTYSWTLWRSECVVCVFLVLIVS